jgi:hypothetical protein
MQALSARVFGVHTWSLVLPQIIAGASTVLFLFRAVRRVAGALAGLIAAVLLAVNPVAGRAEELGAPELLVSNAGRGMHGDFCKAPRDETQAMLQRNMLTGVELASLLLPGMIDRDRGGAVFASSQVGFFPAPHLAAYGASKAFLLSFAESLATELHGTGVRAMALCPGPTASEFADVAGMGNAIDKAPAVVDPAGIVTAGLRA